ncbi:MAG: hypothetical protein ACJ8I9_02650 [Chthoniobacterales bacterium]
MTTKIVLPRTRRAMAIYTVVAIAITAAAMQQHAEQVRVARIRDDIRLIERAERQIAIR